MSLFAWPIFMITLLSQLILKRYVQLSMSVENYFLIMRFDVIYTLPIMW